MSSRATGQAALVTATGGPAEKGASHEEPE